jgi:hypothetical protein
MNRRRFLSLLTLSGAFSMLSGAVPWFAATRDGATPENATLDAPLAHLRGYAPYDIRQIGNAYLRAHPEEADRDHLMNEIRKRRDQSTAGEPWSLASQMRMDFASDRIVQVNGWVLSRTEARVCALALFS